MFDVSIFMLEKMLVLKNQVFFILFYNKNLAITIKKMNREKNLN